MASSLDWQRAKATGSKVLHMGAGFTEVSTTSLVGARLASKNNGWVQACVAGLRAKIKGKLACAGFSLLFERVEPCIFVLTKALEPLTEAALFLGFFMSRHAEVLNRYKSREAKTRCDDSHDKYDTNNKYMYISGTIA